MQTRELARLRKRSSDCNSSIELSIKLFSVVEVNPKPLNQTTCSLIALIKSISSISKLGFLIPEFGDN